EEGPHFPLRIGIELPYAADLGVRDVDLAVSQGDAAGLGEAGAFMRPVGQLLASVAAEGRDPVFRQVPQTGLVVSRHRDVEPASADREIPGRSEPRLDRP